MNNDELFKQSGVEDLCKAFLSLRDEKECRAFLRDLMTPQEIETFGARILAAQMLQEGASYREIAKRTKMSTTTVQRVALWLTRGMGGYKTVLKRIGSNLHHKSDNSVAGL